MKKLAAAAVSALIPALAFCEVAQAQFTAGTVASYAGQGFTTGGVTYSFPTNDYSFAGIGVTPIAASTINLRPDPNGPNTILISCNNWNLGLPDESVSINIYFQVTGADVQGGWQHSTVATGDGSVSESTTVQVNPPAVSTSFQTANSGTDLGQEAWFAEAPQNVVVHITLSSGLNGTASLKSYGTHFGLQWPQLSGITLPATNKVQISFVVPVGQSCTLHSSPDLSNWSALGMFTNTSGTDKLTYYFDPISSSPLQKFYQLSLP
jgi:hypothetical protein